MLLLSLMVRLLVLLPLCVLAVVDVRERRLPTKVVLVVGAAFFLDAIIIRMPIQQVGWHVLLAVGVFLLCALLFAARLLGGGDAKLAAVIFLWTGPLYWLPALMLISVIGTLVSLVSLATRNMAAEQRSRIARVLAMFSGARGVPYGVALAAGGGAIIILPALLPLLLRR